MSVSPEQCMCVSSGECKTILKAVGLHGVFEQSYVCAGWHNSFWSRLWAAIVLLKSAGLRPKYLLSPVSILLDKFQGPVCNKCVWTPKKGNCVSGSATNL